MPSEWSSLLPGLAWELAPGRFIGAQMQDQLRGWIRDGRLRPGDVLPSSRRLASHLGVSRGTVSQVYEQLTAEGYLDTRTGAAPRVAVRGAAQARSTGAVQRSRPLAIDFRPGVPDLGSFPVQDWVRCVGEAARDGGRDVFGYGDPRGDAEMRAGVAGYLRRVRAAAAEPENVVVCAGFAQGLRLVLAVLAGRNVRTLALEDPGDPSLVAVARTLGLEVVAVHVDEQGLDVNALNRSGARAVVLTPAHQSPTGAALSPDRRRALVEWAKRVDGWVIEDDYDSEFRYDRAPLGVVQGLMPDRVALLGSTSKTLAPALRLGWVVAPPAMAGEVAAVKVALDRGSPSIDQRALAGLLRTGRYEKHIRRMRAVYSERRETLVDVLARVTPASRLSGLAGGFHAVLELPRGRTEASVLDAARSRSVGLYAFGAHRTGTGAHSPALVLGYGNTSVTAITQGIEAVGDLLRP
ncbi:MAG: PLP-dependent aminotransferase family protein [Actinomycetota bacterium]|nr:PLP-dependent aminotransferase family protein [Actinomycetota bacterium]